MDESDILIGTVLSREHSAHVGAVTDVPSARKGHPRRRRLRPGRATCVTLLAVLAIGLMVAYACVALAATQAQDQGDALQMVQAAASVMHPGAVWHSAAQSARLVLAFFGRR